jgi:peroxiredoxin
MMYMKTIGLAVILTVLLACLVGISSCSDAGSQSVSSGILAPDFALKDLKGQTVNLGNFRGKAVLINFWSTTCPPCVSEMPNFESVYQDWSNRNDRVLLTIDLGEDINKLNAFMTSHRYSFPVLLDSAYQVAGKYGIQYTPTTFLIDKNGEFLFRFIGAFPDKQAIIKKVGDYLPN